MPQLKFGPKGGKSTTSKRDEIAQRLQDNGMEKSKAFAIATATVRRMVNRGDNAQKFKPTPRKE